MSVMLVQIVVMLVILVMGSNSSIVVQLATILLREAAVLSSAQVQVLQDSVRTVTKHNE